jgi:hypothetical protein
MILAPPPQVPHLEERGLELPEEFQGFIPVQGRCAGGQHGDGAPPVLDEFGGRQLGHRPSVGEQVFGALEPPRECSI